MLAEQALSHLTPLQQNFEIISYLSMISLIAILIAILIGPIALLVCVTSADSKMRKITKVSGAITLICIMIISTTLILIKNTELSDTQLAELQATPHRIVNIKKINIEPIPDTETEEYISNYASGKGYFTKTDSGLTKINIPKNASIQFEDSKKSNQPKNVLMIKTVEYENKRINKIIPTDENTGTHLEYVFAK